MWDGEQICQVLLDPLGCDAAHKCEIIRRTDRGRINKHPTRFSEK